MGKDGLVHPQVDLLIPIKPLWRAKTRLRGVVADHDRLALAVALDTMLAARAARTVRRVVAISSDPTVVDALRAGEFAGEFDVVPDEPDSGLNAALAHGEQWVRREGATGAIGALQADLPALRAAELDLAVSTGLRTHHRSFCPDRPGTGTTLLLSAVGALQPRFGPESADAHESGGAVRLAGWWPTLRCDVDTIDDLAAATELGLGRHTTLVLSTTSER